MKKHHWAMKPKHWILKQQRWIVPLLVMVLIIGSVGLVVHARGVTAEPMAQRSPAEWVGGGITYQGYLDDGGSPANGTYDFQFVLFDALTDGAQVGSIVTADDVVVADGRFSALLDFGGGVFDGNRRFLEISVRPGAETGAYTPLSPRQELTPAPYAQALPGLWTSPGVESPNIIGGYSENWVSAGAWGAAIGGGGVSWGYNRVTDHVGTIGGGANNQAGNDDGDFWNSDGATVSGGWDNTASGSVSTVGGGGGNTASSMSSTVSGGWSNSALGEESVVGGGGGNVASGGSATIGGGGGNTASGDTSTVGGGYGNVASGQYEATVSGGGSNSALQTAATVGGGTSNTANGWAATISGGYTNTITADVAVIGGGQENEVTGQTAVIGGGFANNAAGDGSVIGGGELNSTGGYAATVPGGNLNTASGDVSFAAGYRAQAAHTGAFVWADSTEADFTSTAPDQFLVRATGGAAFAVGDGAFEVNGRSLIPPGNVVIVAQSGGDFSSVQAALDSITDASESNPYLVWVGPGVYEETVIMKPYVDIEGAGEGVTKITSAVATVGTGTVRAASHSELRYLTVENTGTGDQQAAAIYVSGTAPRITHVTAQAVGTVRWQDAIYVSGGQPVLLYATLIAYGGYQVNGGIDAWSGSAVEARDVEIWVPDVGRGASFVSSFGSLERVTIVVDDPDMTSTGNMGVYTQSGELSMRDSMVTVNGSESAYGIYHNFAEGYAAVVENSTIAVNASGTTLGLIGIANDSGDLTLKNSTVTTWGGERGYALENSMNGATTAVYVFNSVLSSTGASIETRGIKNVSGSTTDTYDVYVNNSNITGENSTIQSDTEFTVLVGSTWLSGGGVFTGGGTVTCAGVYDENYTFYASSCP